MAVMVSITRFISASAAGLSRVSSGSGIRRHHDRALNPGQFLPDLFGDEGHEGVEQPQDGAQDPSRTPWQWRPAGRVFFGIELGLDELQVPVAELVPDELVEGVGRQVELIGVQARRDLFGDLLQAAHDPGLHHGKRLIVRGDFTGWQAVRYRSPPGSSG